MCGARVCRLVSPSCLSLLTRASPVAPARPRRAPASGLVNGACVGLMGEGVACEGRRGEGVVRVLGRRSEGFEFVV